MADQKKKPAKSLSGKDMKKTKGGAAKKGADQQQFLKIELKDVIIS